MSLKEYFMTPFFMLVPQLYKLTSNIKGKIRPFVIISDPVKATVGEGTVIREFTFLKGRVEIGKDCVISHFIVFDAGGHRIKIGNNTTVGAGAKFWCEPNHYEPGPPNLSWKSGNISIGERVVIGSNATILTNVKIGDGSAIGANAVVTKDVPPNSIAVGVPAKVIKKIK